MSHWTSSKRIIETAPDAFLDNFFAIKRHWAAKDKRKQSQVIQSKDVVRMLVRIQNRVHNSDAFAQQLSSQVGRGIDQQIATGQTQDR